MQIDEPIFRSVQQALHFSFLMETLPVSQKSQMHEIYQQGGQRIWGEEKHQTSTIKFGGLTALEVRGQCAMVRGAVNDHLDVYERHAVYARYSYQKVKAEGVRVMRDCSLASMSCKDEWATIAMAWSVFGNAVQMDGLSTRVIANEFGLSQSSVARDVMTIKKESGRLMISAVHRLQFLFASSGLIETI